MEAKQLSVHCWKFWELILVSLCIVPGMSLAASREISSPDSQVSGSLVSQRISFLINQIIKRSAIKLKDGSSATTMPVLPSSADLQEVKRFGDQAVKALAVYVNSTQAMEQYVSLRFLFEFQNDSALAAVQSFAEGSKFAGIRQEAVGGLTGFPWETVKPIIERISNRDPNPDVRACARHVLLTYLHGQSGATP
jgi:hypothetical protein